MIGNSDEKCLRSKAAQAFLITISSKLAMLQSMSDSSAIA